MAQKVITTLVDDMDGTPIEDGQGETIKFSLDGSDYEIDLSAGNAKGLRDALKPYVKAGRPAARRRSGGAASKSNKDELNAIREWWRGQGNEISDRGRIPTAVVDAYRASK